MDSAKKVCQTLESLLQAGLRRAKTLAWQLHFDVLIENII